MAVFNLEIIWSKYNDYIIRDVYEKLHDKVKKFMLENYFIPNRLFKQLKFEEDPNINGKYLDYVDHILHGEGCIVVLNETTNEIMAVALCKCMTKEWRSWTALKLCNDKSKFSDVMELHYYLFKKFEADLATTHSEVNYDTFHVFEYFIEENLRQDYDFVMHFFNAIYETARHLKMPYLTISALSQAEQQMIFEQGYEELNCAIYSIYTEGKRRPFALLRDIDEMQAILFGIDVDALIPFHKMKVRGIDDTDQRKLERSKSVGKVTT